MECKHDYTKSKGAGRVSHVNTHTYVYIYNVCVSPENNDLLRCVLPPLVLLEADVTAVLSWVESSCDSSTQVSQGPVEVVVQQIGGCFK